MLPSKVVHVLKTIPVLALRFPGGGGSHISIQSALEGGTTAFTPGKYSSYSFLLGYSAAGRIKSMKHSIDTIGNRTRDVPACSAVGWGQTTRRFVFGSDLSLAHGYSPTARARSQASPYGITGEKSSTGTGLSLRSPVSLTNIILPMPVTHIHSSSTNALLS